MRNVGYRIDVHKGIFTNIKKMTGCIEHYTIPQSRLPPSSPITSHLFFDETDDIGCADYRFESTRRESFKNWPCLWIKPEKLAAAGFYYTGESDKVKCFECQIEICEWQVDDNPMADHQRWSGRCRFIRNIPCGNVPIGTDPNTIPAPVPKGVDVCGPYGSIYMPYSGPDHEEIEERVNCKLRGMASRPKHPEYASCAARLASFDRWPKAMSQTKETLATAGFYYTGSGDQTLCYHCGGGLRDWEPEDDPWVEHAKWFEYCPYLILTKGTEFVSSITGRTYVGAENIPSAINKLGEKIEKDNDAESIASGSSQNSICSEETHTTEVSAVSGEASSEEQSVQGDKPCDKDARSCKICYSREVRIVFMPCGHLLACAECAKNMKICGVCRKPVERTVQAYIS
ncbi:baculoviral IAP repeat-containing protein 7-B-like isoform X1 [Temnothorax curvispinosus]|uniref:Baculoviral IAP repeat-containing protein 7-B-like isoform X1 n=2 Tax=Temnothorax curvispinosus TaxID=300111 RepID=A0A6J1Q2H7_9HYME|nr:baculoviral IAP repeat-containing protein 7-B-like isoform X1 [Temnothorax curvispinosus]